MIKKEQLEVGTKLISKEETSLDTHVIDWGANKNVFFLDKARISFTIEQINRRWELKPIEEWVDCPIVDISFATKDRVECKCDGVKGYSLICVATGMGNNRNFLAVDCEDNMNFWDSCQVKKSDLHKFEE